MTFFGLKSVQNVIYLYARILSVTFPLIEGRINNVRPRTASHQKGATSAHCCSKTH